MIRPKSKGHKCGYKDIDMCRSCIRSCCRIVLLLGIAVVGLYLLIVGVLIVDYCASGNFSNKIASLKDLAEYVISDHGGNSLKEWKFSPSSLDFGQTNRLYAVEFSPRKARKHVVYLRHENLAPLSRSEIEKLINGAVLKISVYNAQTGELFEKVARAGFSTRRWTDKFGDAIDMYTTSI